MANYLASAHHRCRSRLPRSRNSQGPEAASLVDLRPFLAPIKLEVRQTADVVQIERVGEALLVDSRD